MIEIGLNINCKNEFPKYIIFLKIFINKLVKN